jgi:hypothetical protein
MVDFATAASQNGFSIYDKINIVLKIYIIFIFYYRAVVKQDHYVTQSLMCDAPVEKSSITL